MRDVTV